MTNKEIAEACFKKQLAKDKLVINSISQFEDIVSELMDLAYDFEDGFVSDDFHRAFCYLCRNTSVILDEE